MLKHGFSRVKTKRLLVCGTAFYAIMEDKPAKTAAQAATCVTTIKIWKPPFQV